MSKDHKSVRDAWDTILRETEAMATAHAEFAVHMKDVNVAGLDTFVQTMKPSREGLAAEGAKLQRMMAESKENLYKANVAYERACRELEEGRLVAKEKDKKKLEKLQVTAQEKEVEYRSAVKNTNYFQDKMLDEQLPELLAGLQKIEEKRVDIIKEHLVAYLAAQCKIPEQFATGYRSMHAAVKAINRQEDLQAFIASCSTGEPRPEPFVFSEYRSDAVPVEKTNKLFATLKTKGAQLLRRDKFNSGGDEEGSGGGAGSPVGPERALSPGPRKPAKGKVYGTTLEEVMEHQSAVAPGLPVPKVLTALARCVIENGGTTTEGIFRVPADSSEVAGIKAKLELLEFDAVAQIRDPHLAAGALKLWLRELEEPLIPASLYDQALAAGASGQWRDAEAILEALPQLNLNVVRHVVHFLQLFKDKSSISKMTPPNLAMVFAPGFLRCPSDNPAVILANNNSEKSFVLLLIENIEPDSTSPTNNNRNSVGNLEDVQI